MFVNIQLFHKPNNKYNTYTTPYIRPIQKKYKFAVTMGNMIKSSNIHRNNHFKHIYIKYRLPNAPLLHAGHALNF